ncbi:MAG: hypothetical protein MUF15_13765 [Acidobacteria bacterium]|jgi:hypothetical protein|nr:hypothetical protein [Acidobacteriota bacterium]
MKQLFIIILLHVLILTAPLLGMKEFRPIQQWNHGDQGIYTSIFDALIDNDEHVVIAQGKVGLKLITPEKVIFFAPIGQGPSDIYMMRAMCNYKTDAAFIEMTQKVKIFTKKDNTYKWKETKWLKQEYYSHSFKRALFINEKWFLAGEKDLAKEEKQKDEKKQQVNLLKVYDNNGKPLASLINRTYEKPNGFYLMEYYLAGYKSNVFLMAENELKVYQFDVNSLIIIKETSLEVPSFYKKMPEDFYIFKKYDDDPLGFNRDYEYWKVSYSRIENISVEDGYLVVQIRTFQDSQKKFALLFYNADNLKLEKTIFVNDYFLGSRNSKYYFYANGNPGRDEDTDKCIINIYAFDGKQ